MTKTAPKHRAEVEFEPEDAEEENRLRQERLRPTVYVLDKDVDDGEHDFDYAHTPRTAASAISAGHSSDLPSLIPADVDQDDHIGRGSGEPFISELTVLMELAPAPQPLVAPEPLLAAPEPLPVAEAPAPLVAEPEPFDMGVYSDETAIDLPSIERGDKTADIPATPIAFDSTPLGGAELDLKNAPPPSGAPIVFAVEPIVEAAAIAPDETRNASLPAPEIDDDPDRFDLSIDFAAFEEPELEPEPEPIQQVIDLDSPKNEVHVHHHYESAPAPSVASYSAPPLQTATATEFVAAEAESDYEQIITPKAERQVVNMGVAEDPLPEFSDSRSTPKPIEEPKVKDPLFVWAGKPLGSGPKSAKPSSAPASDTGSSRVVTQQAPARKSRQAQVEVKTPRLDASGQPIPGEFVDAQTWFEETMKRALDLGVSDLHIGVETEPNGQDILTARIRIDGQMQVMDTVYGMDARIILNKFKAAAELPGNSYIPEESIYEVEVNGEIRKARIALFRTARGGDALVLRLPPTGELRRLEDLEFAPINLALFHDLLKSSNRMILIAGPMGSGKTTTAHAALMEVATSTRTVWSVEDPVERDLPGLTQLEINEENGAGFEQLLPVLVRSDYDTLFLGEIRDKATAGAGVRQAKAGRQVISTIHANDNVTALLRLIELSQDGALSVMDAVLGVVSQRLVRKLNPNWDGVDEKTKYKGRVPVHEVLRVNDELTEAVMRDAPIAEIKAIAERSSESTFAGDAKRLIDAGITDRAEIDRVLYQSEH